MSGPASESRPAARRLLGLTDRGSAALGAGAGLTVLWAALGEIELLTAAVLVVSVTMAAVIFVRVWRPSVTVTRRLYPPVVHEGDQTVVELEIQNTGRRSLRQVTVVDTVGLLGSAVFALAGLRRGTIADGAYQIICRPRGVHQIGPATAVTTDPLKLASSQAGFGSTDRLVVYPASEELIGLPLVKGRDPAMHTSRPDLSVRGGEDFFTLREYRQGDDLRRVHWPSSAKRDDLMIRQMEAPWQARALVVLDVRRSVYESSDCFEKAVKGAASVVRHLSRSGFVADLWAGGSQSVSAQRYAEAMEALALVMPEDNLDLASVAARLSRSAAGGTLFMVTGVPDVQLINAQALLARQFGSTVLLCAAESSVASVLQMQRAGVVTMTVPPEGSWGEAWIKARARTWGGSVSAG